MRTRIVLAVIGLLAAVLIVGLTTDAQAGGSPADKVASIVAELAQHAEDQVEGMSCTGTAAVGASHDLLVVTVVCRAKTAEWGQ